MITLQIISDLTRKPLTKIIIITTDDDQAYYSFAYTPCPSNLARKQFNQANNKEWHIPSIELSSDDLQDIAKFIKSRINDNLSKLIIDDTLNQINLVSQSPQKITLTLQNPIVKQYVNPAETAGESKATGPSSASSTFQSSGSSSITNPSRTNTGGNIYSQLCNLIEQNKINEMAEYLKTLTNQQRQEILKGDGKTKNLLQMAYDKKNTSAVILITAFIDENTVKETTAAIKKSFSQLEKKLLEIMTLKATLPHQLDGKALDDYVKIYLHPIDKPNEQGQSALIQAVLNQNPERVKLLLSLGANPSFKDRQSNTALSYAITLGNAEIFDLLIKAKPDLLDIPNHKGDTPLKQAIKENQIGVIDKLKAIPDLLLTQIKKELTDNKTPSSLMIALNSPAPNTESIATIIDVFIKDQATYFKYINKPLVEDTTSDASNNAVLYALYRGHFDVATLLLSKLNSDQRIQLFSSAYGTYANHLHFLITNLKDDQHLEKCIKIIFECFKTSEERKKFLNPQTNTISTLELAIKKGHNKSIIKLLLDSGAEISQAAIEGLAAPSEVRSLLYALKYPAHDQANNFHEVEQQLKKISRTQLSAEDSNRRTPLILAIFHDNKEMLAYLLKQPAEDKENDNKPTKGVLLILATQFGSVECANYLIAQGTNINCKDLNGLTPLMHAIDSQCQEMIELLLEQSALDPWIEIGNKNYIIRAIDNEQSEITSLLIDCWHKKFPEPFMKFLNSEDGNGHTPIMYALYKGDMVSAKKMLDLLADNKARQKHLEKLNKDKETILFDLMTNYSLDDHTRVTLTQMVLSYFPEKAAKANLVNILCHGKTALMCAIESGNTDTVMLLLAAGANPNFVHDDQSALTLALALQFNPPPSYLEFLLNLMEMKEIDRALTQYPDHEALVRAKKRLGKAAYEGAIQDMKHYLSLGDDINALYEDESPLHSAIKGNHIAVVKMILDIAAQQKQKTKSNTDSNSTREQKSNDVIVDDPFKIQNALNVAIKLKRNNLVALLLNEGGASANSADHLGNFPLFAAIYHNNIEALRLLIKFHVNTKQISGYRTPLIAALKTGNEAGVEILCEHPLDITAEDENGIAPLMIATTNNSLRSVKNILKCLESLPPEIALACLEKTDPKTNQSTIDIALTNHYYEIFDCLDKEKSKLETIYSQNKQINELKRQVVELQSVNSSEKKSNTKKQSGKNLSADTSEDSSANAIKSTPGAS